MVSIAQKIPLKKMSSLFHLKNSTRKRLFNKKAIWFFKLTPMCKVKFLRYPRSSVSLRIQASLLFVVPVQMGPQVRNPGYSTRADILANVVAYHLKNEADRVAGRSVADRIITMTKEGKDKLVVETTTEKLAQHLGRAVYKAYKGDLDFRWSEMNKFVRVYWTR